MDAHQILTDKAVDMPDSGMVLQGDCVDVMRRIPSYSVDFVLTDPPYITRYRARDGRASKTMTTTAGCNRPSCRSIASSSQTHSA
jgi:hypothetical protein